MMKICNKCRKEKPEEEFPRVRKESTKRRSVCKECQTREVKEYAASRKGTKIVHKKPENPTRAQALAFKSTCPHSDCKYVGSTTRSCDYRLFTGQGRGCQGGDECIRYEPRTQKRTTRETALTCEFMAVGVGEWL